MVTDHLMDHLGSQPIVSVKRSVSIGTMLNFDGDSDGTCKQAWSLEPILSVSVNLTVTNTRDVDGTCKWTLITDCIDACVYYTAE